jgi:hypothetical protein
MIKHKYIKSRKINNQAGFTHILLFIILVAVIAFIGFAGYKVTHGGDHKNSLANGKCSGSGTSTLTNAPMKTADIGIILPYGGVFPGGHVTPVDHQYYYQANPHAPADTYNVYAPGDGEISDIQNRTQAVGDQNASGNGAPVNQYRIVISYSCNFQSYYDLLTSIQPDIKVGAHVKAGQVIGKIGGESLDFAVWDTTKTLPGLAVPKAYAGEAWKIHTVAPLDHFSDSVKNEILPFYERTVAPRDGKLDYDVVGKVVGNWFIKGSGGYSGQPGAQPSPTYYRSHLSIAPDYLDPTSIVYSTGDYQGQAVAFGIKGNAPDPATIGVANTPTKYELVNTSYVTADGRSWTGMSLAPVTVRQGNQTKAIALVQLVDTNTLKEEIFVGKTAAQVTGFDSAAKTYTRSGL